MPTALTVDQSFVDNYLARVDRFCKNVEDLGRSIQEFAGRFTVQEQAEPSTRKQPPIIRKLIM